MPTARNILHDKRAQRWFFTLIGACVVLTAALTAAMVYFDGVLGAAPRGTSRPTVVAPQVVRPGGTTALSWGVQDERGRLVQRGLTPERSDYAKIDLVVTERDGDRRIVPLVQQTADDGRERVRIPQTLQAGDRVSFRVAVFPEREPVPAGETPAVEPRPITAASSQPATVGRTPFAAAPGVPGGGGGGGGGSGGGGGGSPAPASPTPTPPTPKIAYPPCPADFMHPPDVWPAYAYYTSVDPYVFWGETSMKFCWRLSDRLYYGPEPYRTENYRLVDPAEIDHYVMMYKGNGPKGEWESTWWTHPSPPPSYINEYWQVWGPQQDPGLASPTATETVITGLTTGWGYGFRIFVVLRSGETGLVCCEIWAGPTPGQPYP